MAEMIGRISTTPQPKKLGAQKVMLIPWDMSEKPTTNDRVKKLGRGDGTHGAAFFDFDKKTNKAKLVDGYHGDTITSIRLLEPDNWVFRLHTKRGAKKDGVLALRMTTDDVNRDYERKNRSTMWINQCNTQVWAWSRDLFKVKALGASCKDEELRFNGAGFLSMFASTDTASGGNNRGALMLNVSKRGGYTTDGVLAGQFHHILSLVPGGSGTVAGSGDDSCSDVSTANLALRGDVNFDIKGKLTHIAIEKDDDHEEDDPYTGYMYVSGKTAIPAAPGREMATETAVSNQISIGLKHKQCIRPLVKIPKLVWMPVPPRPVPPGFPSVPAGTITPTTTTQGAVTGENFATAVCTGINWSAIIPPKVAPTKGFNVLVNFITPSAGVDDDITLQLDWCTIAKGAAVTGLTLTGTETKTITAAAYTGNNNDYLVSFWIPATDLIGKELGKISCALYRRGDTDRSVRDLVIHWPSLCFSGRIYP